MRPKTAFTYIFLILLIFIVLGDKFLPGGLGEASANTREGINNFFKGIFPQKEFVNPYERTEKEVEKLQKQKP
jgi:hypothetical protein